MKRSTESSFGPDTDELRRLVAEESLILDVTEQIIDALRSSGLSQKAIADRLGISRACVSRTLNGETNMTLRTAAAYVWAMNHTIAVRLVPPPDEEDSGDWNLKNVVQISHWNKCDVSEEDRSAEAGPCFMQA